MLRVTFFVALALFVSVIAFFATAFHVPLTHHPKSIDELRLSSAQKLLQIHRSLHARGHQPKGARLIQKLEEGNVGLFPNVPMSDNVMAGSYTDSLCDPAKYPECGYVKRYNNLSSSTFENKCTAKVDGKESCFLFLPYGSGTAYGTLSMDKVQVGGADLGIMNFGRIYALPGSAASWGKQYFDGILGLAFDEIAMPIGSFLPGPFEVMYSKGIIPEKVFSVYLSNISNSTTSYVYFGGKPNDSHFSGPLVTAQMPLAQLLYGYWMTDFKSMTVGGKPVSVGSEAYAISDTGTTLLSVPPKYAKAIVPFTNPAPDCSNLHSLPDVTLTMGIGDGKTHTFTMTGEQYTYKVALANGTMQCQNGFFSFDVGEGIVDLWIFGDTFLRNFPAVFDMTNRRISYANAGGSQ